MLSTTCLIVAIFSLQVICHLLVVQQLSMLFWTKTSWLENCLKMALASVKILDSLEQKEPSRQQSCQGEKSRCWLKLARDHLGSARISSSLPSWYSTHVLILHCNLDQTPSTINNCDWKPACSIKWASGTEVLHYHRLCHSESHLAMYIHSTVHQWYISLCPPKPGCLHWTRHAKRKNLRP